jgi:hypothetical protein
MRFRVINLFLLVALAAAPIAWAQAGGDFGTLTVTVRPANADIFVDGERWVSPDTTGPLAIQLAPGRHTVEARAPGHRPFSTLVDVRRGETTPLNVILPAGAPAPGMGEPPPPPAGPPPVGRPPGPRGPIQEVSRSESGDGGVWAPDFKITEINHRTAGFAGFYGGMVFGGKVMIGGGAYFQLDDWEHHDSEQIAYGGFVAEYRLFPDKPIGLQLHGLIGGGASNVGTYYANYGQNGAHVDPRHGVYYGPQYGPYAYEGFFVGEPEAQIVARFGHNIRLVAGGGYRWTSSDFQALNSWTASIGLQIGK